MRVEFWGDEVSELRSFAVADQRSVGPVEQLLAPGCRELLLTEPVRARAAALARTYENNPALRELLEHLAEGIPTEGMESLIPVLAGGELELLTDLLPAGALVLLADPERIRTRGADLVRTGQEFLAASVRAGWRRVADRRRRSATAISRGPGARRRHRRPGSRVAALSAARRAPRVHESSLRGDTDRAVVDLRAHVITAAPRCSCRGNGSAQRSLARARGDLPPSVDQLTSRRPPAGHGDLRQLTAGFTTGGSTC